MNHIFYFKREKPRDKTTLFLRFNLKIDNEFVHIMEHILIARLQNDGFHILDGHSTQDYIKISLMTNFDIKHFNPNYYLNLFNSQELNRAINEIKQEKSLLTNDIQNILNKIRKTENKESVYKKLDYYNENLKMIIDKIIFIIINNDLHTEKVNSILSRDYRNKTKKEDFIVNSGTLYHNNAEFFFKYINIPLFFIKKDSTIFFIQKLVTFLNEKLNNLRNKGIYYSVAFALYDSEKIELFILISFTNDTKLNFNSEIENILEDYDIKRLNDNNYGEITYDYKENLSVIFMSPAYLTNSTPNISNESVWITNKIIQKLNY